MRTQPASVLKAKASFGLIALLLVGCAPLHSVDKPQIRPPHAIESPAGHGYGGIIVDVNAPFTDAFENLLNESPDPIVIVAFELIDTPPEIELVDVLLAGDERAANIQWEKNFPPTENDMGPLIPAIGASLLPHTEQSPEMNGYSLIVGMKVTAPGKWVRGGYRITFLQNGQRYSNEVVANITLCTPDAVDADGECIMEIPEN